MLVPLPPYLSYCVGLRCTVLLLRAFAITGICMDCDTRLPLLVFPWPAVYEVFARPKEPEFRFEIC